MATPQEVRFGKSDLVDVEPTGPQHEFLDQFVRSGGLSALIYVLTKDTRVIVRPRSDRAKQFKQYGCKPGLGA